MDSKYGQLLHHMLPSNNSSNKIYKAPRMHVQQPNICMVFMRKEASGTFEKHGDSSSRTHVLPTSNTGRRSIKKEIFLTFFVTIKNCFYMAAS